MLYFNIFYATVITLPDALRQLKEDYRRRTPHIVQAVHSCIQRLTVLAGEAKMHRGFAKLVDKVAKVRRG